MMKPFAIEPSPHRAGFYRCLFNGQPPQLISALRSTIGAVCVSGIWIVPFDRLGYIVSAAKECGYHPDGRMTTKAVSADAPNKKLYPYQRAGVARSLLDGRLMFNYKPGLGKTATALESMKQADVSTALIVCPAIVRETWAQQFALWWPQAAHKVQIIETGKEAALAEAPFVVVSYELMAKVPPRDWQAIVFDECHFLKDASSKRSREAKAILEAKTLDREVMRLWLTGTPIANEPVDLHNQVELLYPGLWGNIHEFKRRYCLQRDEPYAYSGKVYYGVNPRFAAELKDRLTYVSMTATEEEVAGLLPPIVFEPIRIRPEKTFNIREYLDNFTRRDLHNSKSASEAIRACGQVKIDTVVELIRNDFAGGSTHVSVMTHMRSTAYEIANALAGEGIPIGVITGANDHKARHAEIARLAKEPKAIFVGTMHCVSVGINELKDFPDVIYAELDYRPDEVVQSMKRYHRIGGKANVRIRVLILEGTLEERVAKSIGRKLRDQKMISDVGTLTGDLEEALDAKMTDEDFYMRMQEAAAKMSERDIYV